MRNTVLLADSSPTRRGKMRSILESRFAILEAGTLEQMQILLEHNEPHLAVVIIDISWMEETQESILTDMKRRMPDIPAIAVVDAGDQERECRALGWGADEAVLWPFQPELVMKRIDTIISLYRYRWNLESIINEQQEVLRHSNEVLTDVLSSLIEHRSIESGNHILRIRRFTQILLEEVARNCPEYNLDSRAIQMISSAAALHDIGKIAIPDAVLNKPGRLTAEEFEVMKRHAAEGSVILERLGGLGNEEYLRYAYNICRYHHERWDGNGYPEGLAGEDIPICAQVVALADVYDALTTPRVYKEAYSHSTVVNMILMGECGQFSRKLIECFKCVKDDFAELAQQYSDGSLLPSANLSAPMPLPQRPAENTLQSVLSKYDLLLSHLSATVMDIEWTQGICHLVYNANPGPVMRQETAGLAEVIRYQVLHAVHPDDRSMLIEQYNAYLDAFFESGLRRGGWDFCIRDIGGDYVRYCVTTLRIQTGDDRRKALAIWEQLDRDSIRRGNDNAAVMRAADAGGIVQQCRYDRRLTLENVSDEFCLLMQTSREGIKEKYENSFLGCIVPGKRQHVLEELDRQLLRGSCAQLIFPLGGNQERTVWVLARCMLASDENRSEILTIILTDITNTEYIWKDGAISTEEYRSIIEQSGDITFSWDLKEDKLACSPRWKERFGYEPISEEVSVQLARRSHFHPDDITALQNKIAVIRSGERFVELTARIADSYGRYYWSCIRAAVLHDAGGRPEKVVGVVIDVGDNLMLSPALLANANRDPLTKLLNKETARQQIESYLSAGRNAAEPPLAAMAIIDLDNFKEINDRFGHLFGDIALERTAMEISSLFRGSDIVSRIGGDEFLVFMTDIPRHELIEARCRTLVEKIKALNTGEMAECQLACSIGISFAPDHGVAYQELFQNADKALYQAKGGGKGCFVTYEPLNARKISPSMIGRIDSAKSSDMVGGNVMKYVFDRLYESGDIEETISFMLEFVGRQLNVSSVYIFENNSSNTHCSMTFEWVDEGTVSRKEQCRNLSYERELANYGQYFNERGIFYCPNTEALERSVLKYTEGQNIRSMLQCAIRDKGVFRGFVGFADAKGNRLWTQEQISLITFLAKVISVFLMKMRGQDQASLMADDLQMVLNGKYAWVYVIEPETFLLRFMNERSQKLVQGRKYGQPCYKVFMNRQEPCENCPIRNTDHTALIHNSFLNLSVKATASRIHWKGKEEWLVTCKEALKEEAERGGE